MRDQQGFDVTKMYNQGCAFLDCAVFTEAEKYMIADRTYSHGYADIALSAFACEIFIKCLIICNNGTYGYNHELLNY